MPAAKYRVYFVDSDGSADTLGYFFDEESARIIFNKEAEEFEENIGGKFAVDANHFTFASDNYTLSLILEEIK